MNIFQKKYRKNFDIKNKLINFANDIILFYANWILSLKDKMGVLLDMQSHYNLER